MKNLTIIITILSTVFKLSAQDENNLVLRFLIFPGDDSPSPADFQIYTYNYHRVTITND